MTQSTSYSIQDKLLWMVGALERLATLGLLNPDVPMKVSSSAIDRYLSLDEDRDNLFQDELEFASILVSLVKSESDPVPSDDEIVDLCELVSQYRDNREETVKFALSHKMS